MILVALVAILGVQPCYAASSATISVTANVPDNTPSLDIVIKELSIPDQDPTTGTTVTTMNFGSLTNKLADGSDAGVWYSPKYYCVFIYSTAFGHHYEVLSTCPGLSDGGNTLPEGSFMLTPGYSPTDEWSNGDPQGQQPPGSTVGEVTSGIRTNMLLYHSETAGSDRIIRAFYALPSYLPGGGNPYPGYTPIPEIQAPGSYAGTVTLTIAAI